MQEEMHVRVDEAGEQRGVAEVDDLGAGRMVDRGADGADAVTFDEDFAGPEQRAGIDLEQARGVEDDGRGGNLRRADAQMATASDSAQTACDAIVRKDGDCKREFQHDTRICRYPRGVVDVFE